MNDEQIRHMVGRFLGWRLPASFRPDGGITFEREYDGASGQTMLHEPTGTNLFDFGQAQEMVEFMLQGLPPSRLEELSDQAKVVYRKSTADEIDAQVGEWLNQAGIADDDVPPGMREEITRLRRAGNEKTRRDAVRKFDDAVIAYRSPDDCDLPLSEQFRMIADRIAEDVRRPQCVDPEELGTVVHRRV